MDILVSLLKPFALILSLLQPSTNSELITYIDKQTGCLYISVKGGDQVTPKLNQEGDQVCLRKLDKVYYVE